MFNKKYLTWEGGIKSTLNDIITPKFQQILKVKNFINKHCCYVFHKKIYSYIVTSHKNAQWKNTDIQINYWRYWFINYYF